MSLGPFAPIPPREKIRRSHINDLRTALTGIQDAYDVAVANGFTGTRGQWLDSLKGEKGDPGAGLAPIGSVETIDDLPSDGNTVGDVRTVDADGRAYRWDGSEWIDVGLFRGPGGEDTELRARTDPGSTGTIGQALRWGPSGPDWGERVISADWFSDVNAAVIAAGAGGTVLLSADTDYPLDTDALGLLPRLTLVGENPRTSRLIVSAGTAVASAAPASMCDYVTLRNLTINGQPGAQVGIDARGLTRSLIENVYVNGFADVQVWYGGDSATYHSSWTNTYQKGEVNPPDGATGFRFSGVTGTGASTPNNIGVYEVIVNIGSTPTSYGFDFQAGDTNIVQHCDVGYSSGDGVAFLISGGINTSGNVFIANRSEATPRGVLITGDASYNAFIRNQFGGSHATYHPVEITGAAQWTTFLANSYSAAALTPHVYVSGPATNTTRRDMDLDPALLEMAVQRGSGAIAFSTYRNGEANRRFAVVESGALVWYDPTNGTMRARLRMLSTSTGVMAWDDNNMVKVPLRTSLPGAGATYRGVMLRTEGAAGVADGLYWCRKKDDDTYEWALIS